MDLVLSRLSIFMGLKALSLAIDTGFETEPKRERSSSVGNDRGKMKGISEKFANFLGSLRSRAYQSFRRALPKPALIPARQIAW